MNGNNEFSPKCIFFIMEPLPPFGKQGLVRDLQASNSKTTLVERGNDFVPRDPCFVSSKLPLQKKLRQILSSFFIIVTGALKVEK